MLALFRHNNPLVIILLLLLCTGLHVVAFVYPFQFNETGMNDDVVYVFRNMGINHYASLILGALFIFAQGLYFQHVIRKHEVLYKLSYLPSTLYIICCSAFSEQLAFTPQLIIGFLLIVILDNLLKLYKTPKPFETIFNCGFLLGLATIISIEVSIFFLMLLFALNYFRPFNWKENFSLFLSYLLPFYFAGSIFYLTDKFEPFYHYYLDTGWLRFNRIEQAFETRFLVISLIFVIILILGFFRLSNNFIKNPIKSRKAQFVTGVMLFLGMVIMGARRDQFFPNFTLMAMPVSLFTAYYFISPRFRLFKELLFISLLFWIFYFQWKPHW